MTADFGTAMRREAGLEKEECVKSIIVFQAERAQSEIDCIITGSSEMFSQLLTLLVRLHSILT